MLNRLIFYVAFSLIFQSAVKTQDLSGFFEDDFDVKPALIEKTFRTPRIVNMHSVENPVPGEMIMNIGHRFGRLNTGFYELFGLDQATMRLGFDYGVNDWLGLGIGRSSFQKTYDAFLKARIIGQGGKSNFPLTLTIYSSASVNTLRNVFPEDNNGFSDRLGITNSVMIARKFGEKFSLQLNPIWLRSNYLPEIQSGTDDLSLGMAARIRLLPRVHLNMEYIHELIDDKVEDKNPLSFGFDIETGGHVFQLFFSSTQGIFDKAYLINTNETWKTGGIYFGFNITRVFYFK